MRKIAETPMVQGVEVRTYRNPEQDEFEVRPYVDGKLVTEWIYFTDDKSDALNSMKLIHKDILASSTASLLPAT